MTFDEGSNPPPWGAPPPPPPSSTNTPGHIAPNPYAHGFQVRAHDTGNTAMREIDAQPDVNWTNRGAVSAGRTCGIVGSCFLILFALWLLLWVGIITSLAVR